MDRLSESHPKLADDLIPKVMSLGEVQKVLQQLLREQVSIRDLGTILETLVDAASFNKNPIALVEAVRHTQGRALIRPLLNEQGELRVVTLDTAIEDECLRGSNLPVNQTASTPQQVTLARRVLDGLRANFGKDITLRHRSCCVLLQAATTFAACWSRLSPRSWSSLLGRFPR